MEIPVRVRFAPSPTGPLHIGGVRTALFNYLFARKHHGTLILRIEDTDNSRYVQGAEEYIMNAFSWCGIGFDEGIREGGDYGPYRQSERMNIYKEYTIKLIEKGAAYYAFDTPEELEKARETAGNKGGNFVYNASTRGQMKNSFTLSEEEIKKQLRNNTPNVIRFKTTPGKTIICNDIIRGNISVGSDMLDDKILLKADGMPTYHLANVVDDHLMKISHVIRGEEWLPSLPLHVQLYQAFGWGKEMPRFAHLPLILKPEGKGKLSKRDGDKMGFPVFPLQWETPEGEIFSGYRESGYLPQAFLNMLALLGWNPGTENEVFMLEELIHSFSLDKVGKSGSRFDPQKAIWFNHQHLQRMDIKQLTTMYIEALKSKNIHLEYEKAQRMVSLVRDRVDFVGQMVDETLFFFQPPQNYDEKTVRKKWSGETAEQIRQLIPIVEHCSPFHTHIIEDAVKHWITENDQGVGKILSALRLLLVGGPYGPHLFDIMEVLGRKETLSRIENGLDKLAAIKDG